jgi:hypothetical protein
MPCVTLTVYKRGGANTTVWAPNKKVGQVKWKAQLPRSFFFFLSLSLFSSRFYSFLCVCVSNIISSFIFLFLFLFYLYQHLSFGLGYFEGIILSISSGVFLGFYILLSSFTQPISSLLEKQKKFLKNREAET